MSNDEQHNQIVTWGMGGPDHTLTGLTRAEADEAERDLSAWGPVRVALDRDGTPTWASSGQPLPEGNLTRQCLQDLGIKDQQARLSEAAERLAQAREATRRERAAFRELRPAPADEPSRLEQAEAEEVFARTAYYAARDGIKAGS